MLSMKTVSTCSSPLLPTISRLLGELGHLWAAADACPHIDDATRIAWDNLLKEWMDDSSLPLLIRLSSLPRGSEWTICQAERSFRRITRLLNGHVA